MDYQFENFSIPYFKKMLTLYLFLYSVPFYAQIKMENMSMQRGCAMSCCLVQSFLLLLEYIQMSKSTLKEYFSDNWNKLDLTVIFMNYYYFTTKYIIQEIPTKGQDKSVFMMVMDLTVFILGFLKLIYFVRIYENYGHLI